EVGGPGNEREDGRAPIVVKPLARLRGSGDPKMQKNPRVIRVAPGPDVDLEKEDIRDDRGNRIDADYVRRAVENVHKHARSGRPSLTAPGRQSPQVGVRLPEALRAAAEARAKREGKSVSALMRA